MYVSEPNTSEKSRERPHIARLGDQHLDLSNGMSFRHANLVDESVREADCRTCPPLHPM